jgi:hypothetical protein
MKKTFFTAFLIFSLSNVFAQTISKALNISGSIDTTFNSYHSEEISFKNDNAGITLSGTLTIPNKLGKFPAVVLISGNGEHNRNAEFSGHKPFMVIADYLTKKGIAVLRFDKRGVGLSKGNYKTATTFDFASDVTAAIKYLQTRKEINKDKIGLIGHSEGGLIAPIVAGSSRNVAFIVLLAAPGIPGDKLLLLQQSLIAKAKGVSEPEILKSNDLSRKAFDIVKKYTNPEELQTQMTNYITEISKDDPDKPQNLTEEEYVKLQVTKILSPWMVNFLRYDPAVALEKVKCPVLAISGTKDLQVSPKENIDAIKKALTIGGNANVTTKELPDLNHLFQECQTGLPGEYNKIEQSFSPGALTEIANWLTIKLKKIPQTR